jgi:N-acetylglutamate synthase-like GNAT family acetyltransferase
MRKDELHRVGELDRREVIEYIYYFRDGKLELEKEHWDIPEWSDKQKQEYHQRLQNIHQRGGTVIGAFKNRKIAGIIVLDHEFFRNSLDCLNLAGLWVSQPFRDRGVGRHLVELVKKKAKALGAKNLYVSATPSKKTVEFYMSCGFELAKVIDPKLFELEPEDIHMEFGL